MSTYMLKNELLLRITQMNMMYIRFYLKKNLLLSS